MSYFLCLSIKNCTISLKRSSGHGKTPELEREGRWVISKPQISGRNTKALSVRSPPIPYLIETVSDISNTQRSPMFTLSLQCSFNRLPYVRLSPLPEARVGIG